MWKICNFDAKHSDLLLPRDTQTLQQTTSAKIENINRNLYDAAPADPIDELEYVTHSSGIHGAFSKQDRQNFVRNILLEEESNPHAEVLTNMGCIYEYVYDRKTNIMVGLIKKINLDENDNHLTSIEVLQCPPKGAKRDNLYINISENDAFNLDYRIRVTDVLERSMLLAYSLQMTASGHFCKKRKGGRLGYSSYSLAKTRIRSFYNMVETSNKLLLWSQKLVCRTLVSVLMQAKRSET
jgi:hypothetical protein